MKKIIISLIICIPLSYSKTALLMIDMQKGYSTHRGYHLVEGNNELVDQVIDEQFKVIDLFSTLNLPIIEVLYWGSGPAFQRIDQKLEDKNHYTIDKFSSSAFSNYNIFKKQINEIISKEEIHEVVVIGANGSVCVKNTIEGAIKKDLEVIVYNKGIIDFESRNFITPYIYQTCDIEQPECSYIQIDSFKSLENLLKIN